MSQHGEIYIDDRAQVDDDVILGPGTKVWAFASLIRGAVMGVDCNVATGACLDGCRFGDRVRVGHNVAMGPGFLVGDNVFIGPNVTFCNDAWPRVDREGYEPEAYNEGRYAVIVEEGASIGANSVVLPGVRIGARAMIGSGSVVNSDVPADHLFLGRGRIRPIEDRQTRRMRFAR